MKVRTNIVLSLFLSCVLAVSAASASSGACSGHDGVNCSVGNDSDGSVICNDGWTGSSVSFVSECSASTYTAPTVSDEISSEYSYDQARADACISSVSEATCYECSVEFIDAPEVKVEMGRIATSYGYNEQNLDEIMYYIGFDSVFNQIQENVRECGCLTDIVGHNNQKAIQYLKYNGIIDGYEDSTFKPENTVNRAELLKILVGGKGVNPAVENFNNCFPDVTTEWFAPYVCYAKDAGWVEGYPDGTFQPASEVNKVEAIKILVNSQGYQLSASSEYLYDDVDSTQWYYQFLKTAKDKGILEETGANFKPANAMTRAGISENIYRAMIYNSYFTDINEITPDEVIQEEDNSTLEPVSTETISLNGRGAQATDEFSLLEGLAIVSLTHDGNSNFITELLDPEKGVVEFLTNEIGSYEGEMAIMIPETGEYLMNVDADGYWTVAIDQNIDDSSPRTTKSVSGSGNTATDFFQFDSGLTIFNMTHDGDSNFISHMVNSSGDTIAYLSNAIGGYEGSVAEYIEGGTYLFNVDADGEWTIDFEQISSFDNVQPLKTFYGTGDQASEIFRVNSSGVQTFNLSHTGDSNFIVDLMTVEGDYVDLLVNQIGTFDGSKAEFLEEGLYIMNVEADGEWDIWID